MGNSFIRPDTAAEVLDLLTASLGRLTPELRKAAAHVLENSNLVSVTSVREMAQQAAVKPNTLVRMARAIGFEGYEDFRRPFRERVIRGQDDFPDRISGLQSLSDDGEFSGLYTELATASIGNIERMFSGTTSLAIKAAADDIVQAPTTYVLGTGMGNSIAAYFAYLAGMAIGRVAAIPRDGLRPVDGLVRAEGNDVLLAMAFKPYQHEVVDAVTLAVSRGIKVIGISDSPASPIMSGAGHRFVVPMRTPFVLASSVALMSLLEAIIAFVIAAAGQETMSSITVRRQNPDEAGLYWSERDR
ncbi:MurR/RpiR family transcriptional regulator [Hyphomicrobium sp. 99]|uniref:MurR/RpiR family transcriptional regulator n=1 Tax=Hyphomicrobium sp. 99 TaxID=1163419 RepID=UPI0005F77E34|nr:MurR/RpiR family transcriptional regulator [Hyphomicrobium sp. 99]